MESDENRQAIVIEIGRRYLGIEEEIKEHEEKNEKTELNNVSKNNLSSPKSNQLINEKTEGQSLTDSDLVIDILNDELISQVKQKIHSKKLRSRKDSIILSSTLFIDFPKELFEPSFHAVKSYLAGEPFREFEASMFFHR